MAKKATGSSSGATVTDFIAALEHPLKAEVIALRELILALDPAIGEEVKWNAPSFRTHEHFATMNLRSPAFVQLILHLGAKKRATPQPSITDPDSLLEWLGPDRASIKFTGQPDLARKRATFEAVLRQWITHV